MWDGFRCLESYAYYDYAVAFNGTLALGLSYSEWSLCCNGADKAGKDSSCERTWAE